MIFGGHVDDYPHPGMDVASFLLKLASVNNAEPKVWSPIVRRKMHWIEPLKIGAIASLGKNKCTIS